MRAYRRSAPAVIVAMSAAAVLALGGTAWSVGTTTSHNTFDVTGAVFSCAQGDLTVTSGTITSVFHETQDKAGIFHVTGTNTAHSVTLTDAAGDSYSLSGASWFGGKSSDPDGNILIEAADTEHFVIRSASGGVYAKVQSVEHLSPSGSTFSFDRGSCTSPHG